MAPQPASWASVLQHSSRKNSAVWGCVAKDKQLPGGSLMLNSWDTMTALLKAKHLGLSHEGGMEWGVGETRDPNEPVSPQIIHSYKRS